MTISDGGQHEIPWVSEFDEMSYKPSNNSKIFSLKAYFGDGYIWSKLLNSIKKYSQLLYEAYWYGRPYNGDGSRSISRGEYIIETQQAKELKKSLTWLQKTENIQIQLLEA